jgi:hypothetical protein
LIETETDTERLRRNKTTQDNTTQDITQARQDKIR